MKVYIAYVVICITIPIIIFYFKFRGCMRIDRTDHIPRPGPSGETVMGPIKDDKPQDKDNGPRKPD